jgi:two-component system, OmpR family, phosphate regulon response regulator PhoB
MMQDVTINDILVVDDDQATVEFVVEALREERYLCCAAYDGESALLAIESARPALILLDLHMPGLTGLEVAAQLRRHGLAHVPVVLMTADAAALAQFPETTFPAYLLKPFEIDTLFECVARFVRPLRRHPPLSTARPTTGLDTTIK